MPLVSDILIRKFPFTATSGQQEFFILLNDFLKKSDQERPALLLKGYAGTGKTTIISTLIEVLPLLNFRYVLLAPTGRAAKVMSSYAGKTAFTIHKKIYQTVADPNKGTFKFKRQKNYYKNTVFLVDEASMIHDEAEFNNNGLLTDLIEYVYEDPSNKLMLIGDGAQLPPVKQLNSPGLEQEYLQVKFNLSVRQYELKEVMRQELNSGILYNATSLRNELFKKDFQIHFQTAGFKDIYRMTGEKLEDGLRYAYDKYGVENTIIICRSNRQAVGFNQYIRRMIHFFENEIEAGDMLMIVRNNYFFVSQDSPMGFLANGDFVEVMKIKNFEEQYGFRFADLELRLIDYPDQPYIEAKVLLHTLHSQSASLTFEENQELYKQVMLDYQDIKSKRKRKEALMNDPYLNALQIKFAYALTCHKSQGGQWNAVFVDQGYLTDDAINNEYLRWLYTAVTRATDELFLVNFKATFF
ncbi:MAG: ATP-dependent DNA helicase [Candidatus Cyclobacteriaceae bacterium M3_2C_046]